MSYMSIKTHDRMFPCLVLYCGTTNRTCAPERVPRAELVHASSIKILRVQQKKDAICSRH